MTAGTEGADAQQSTPALGSVGASLVRGLGYRSCRPVLTWRSRLLFWWVVEHQGGAVGVLGIARLT